jgi:hypothetical protein
MAALAVGGMLTACAGAPPLDTPTPTAQGLAAECAQGGCRTARDIRLRRADGSAWERHFDRLPPPVQAGLLVTLFAGETLHLDADVRQFRLEDMQVARPRAATPPLTLHLAQDAAPASGMTLTIRNRYDDRLAFAAGVVGLDGGGIRRIMVCPVPGGAVQSIHLPDPAFQMVFTNFRLLPAEMETGCGKNPGGQASRRQ